MGVRNGGCATRAIARSAPGGFCFASRRKLIPVDPVIPRATLDFAAPEEVIEVGDTLAGGQPEQFATNGPREERGEDVGHAAGFGGEQRAQSVEAMVAHGVGLVPEKRELFGEMSVEDNLLLGGFARWRRGQRDQKERMAEVFKLFPRMQERRAQMASTLSGGERQMLAIGRALMARPRLLMLDEPSLGLAPLIVREVLNIVASLRDMGVSVLLVEQNARAALNVADRGYVLEMGEVALTGAAGELMHDRRVIETYLGVGGNKAPPEAPAAPSP